MLTVSPQRPGSPDAVDRVHGRDWVLVIGMHRSGTSAVTGSLAAMGLQEPHAGDLMVGIPGNPNHHESFSLVGFSEHLLNVLGGSWSAPPSPVAGWERGALADEWVAAAADATLLAYPESGPAVMKDPRMCLLLPFWLRVLGRPTGVLFMWRDPLSVARSVAVRSDWPLAVGLALWERYNREALNALAGQNVFMLGYDEMMTDPTVFAHDAARWLSSLGPLDAAKAAQVPQDSLRHHAVSLRPDEGVLLPAQQELVDTLTGLAGHHSCFVPPAGAASTPWTDGVIELRRDLEREQRTVREFTAAHLAAV